MAKSLLTESSGEKPPEHESSPPIPEWNGEESNPWQARKGIERNGSVEWFYLANDREWWDALREDLVEEHGVDAVAAFFEEYWKRDNEVTRDKAIWGVKKVNARDVHRIYMTAMAGHFSPCPEITELLKQPVHEVRAASEIGVWLLDVIRNGKHSELGKLVKAIKENKLPWTGEPTCSPEGDQRGMALKSLIKLLLERKKLPSRDVVVAAMETKLGDDGNHLKPLNAVGLKKLPS